MFKGVSEWYLWLRYRQWAELITVTEVCDGSDLPERCYSLVPPLRLHLWTCTWPETELFCARPRNKRFVHSLVLKRAATHTLIEIPHLMSFTTFVSSCHGLNSVLWTLRTTHMKVASVRLCQFRNCFLVFFLSVSWRDWPSLEVWQRMISWLSVFAEVNRYCRYPSVLASQPLST